MAVTEFDYLCRFCATKMDILMGLPIFEENEQSKSINKKISACLPIQISLNDQLPKVMCGECAFKIEELFDFREKVLQTEDMFLQMLKSCSKQADVNSLNKLEINVIQENLSEQILNAAESSDTIRSNQQNNIDAIPPVLNSVGLTQVLQTEISRDENEVDVFQLDKETARIFDEQMRELKAANPEIEMQLGNEMSINLVSGSLGPIDINYVTSIATSASRELSSDNDETNNEDSLHDGSAHSFELPSTSSHDDKSNVVLVQYTKSLKDELIESALGNPTIDQTDTAWYICPFCNQVASDSKYLVEHFEQHFCNCPNCDLYFTSMEALNLHSQNCIEQKVDVQVKPEPVTASSQVKGAPKVCQTCGKQYRTNYKLQQHMRKHTGEKPFQCTHCEKSFRSKIGLAQHSASHTGQFDYSCSTCGKGFQCKSYLVVHQRVHSDLKPFSCSTCSQTFKTKQSLLDHENRHAGVKPYKCGVCGRSFITKGLCKSHEKIHSGVDNRQYPCHICKRFFVSKSYLATHVLIHTGDKPYLCERCGKGFLTKVDLKIHMTMHTGEKNFKCDVCSKDFARRSALRCHKRSHTGERPYRCDVCGKTFTQFSPMAIHKRLHTGERPYECDLCGKSFVSRSTMMGHRKKHDNANEIPPVAKKSDKTSHPEISQEKEIKKLEQDTEVPVAAD